MKILHLITDLNIGGAENSLYRLLSGMDRERFDSRVVSLIPVGRVGEKIQSLGIRVESLGMYPGRLSLTGAWRLISILRRDRPMILQTWLYHADLLGILAAQAVRLPVVVWNIRNSEMDLSQYRRLSGLVVRACAWLSGWPQVVVSNSHAGLDFHIRFGYHPPRWVIIPNGIDTRVFKPDREAYHGLRQELGLPPETVLIGQVARYDPMKNQLVFLKAAGELNRSGSQVHFVMIGEGITEENAILVDEVHRQGLAGRVHMLGRQDDIGRYESALDVLTSASSFGEGFPNVVAEAMSCAVPCVVTDVGDSAYLVGDTGLVVPPGDPQVLVEAWKRLLSGGEKVRRDLGAAARRRIETQFSLERTIFAYQDLYLSLSTQPAGVDKGKAV